MPKKLFTVPVVTGGVKRVQEEESKAGDEAKQPVKKSRSEVLKEKAEEAKRLNELETMRKAVKMVLVDGATANKASNDTGIEYWRVRRLLDLNDVSTISGDLSLLKVPKKGRRERVPAAVRQAVKEELKRRDMEGNSVKHVPPARSDAKLTVPGFDANKVPNSVAAVITAKLKEHIISTNPLAPLNDFKPVGHTTLGKICKEVAPDKVSVKNWQNARRKFALCDAYNFASLAVMEIITHSQLSGLSVHELQEHADALHLYKPYTSAVKGKQVYNVDKSSTFLGDDKRRDIALAEGSQKKLKELHRDPTYTRSEEEGLQRRAVGYTALTNAAGQLSLFITHIHDHSFNGTASSIAPARMFTVRLCAFFFILFVFSRFIYFLFLFYQPCRFQTPTMCSVWF